MRRRFLSRILSATRISDQAVSKLPRIVLIGFMGSGKTTVGRALANLLECRMVDLDEAISQREGRSIHALIEEEGEAEFRSIESATLRDVLNDYSVDVIALGGGAWMSAGNRELVAERGCCSVWLDAPFELCWQRIQSDKQEGRPLARDRVSAEKLYKERRPLYVAATLRIEVVADMNVDATAEVVALAMDRRQKDEFGISTRL